MMKFLFLLMTCLLLLPLGGCALPRALRIQGVLRSEAPVQGDGKWGKIDADASLVNGGPRAQTEIHATSSLTDTMNWYRQRLRQDGWGAKEPGGSDPLAENANQNAYGAWVYNVYRRRRILGDAIQDKEHIRIAFSPDDEGGTRIQIEIDDDSPIDWSSRFIAQTIYGMGIACGYMFGLELPFQIGTVLAWPF